MPVLNINSLPLPIIQAAQYVTYQIARNRLNTSSYMPSNKVFIVHGHNESVLKDVELFLQKLGLEPVILKDQPNKGKTIIEKFEQMIWVKLKQKRV